jgi:hypothetical protein
MTASTNRTQYAGILVLAVTIGTAIFLVARPDGQSAEGPPVDLTKAVSAEVRNVAGTVVLRGSFVAVNEEDEDFERKAALEVVDGPKAATGEAEIEYAKVKPTTQEVEFKASNLQAGATYSFVVDGHVVARANADGKGTVEVEIDVKMP